MSGTFEVVHGPLGRPVGGLAWDGTGMLFADINDSVILRYDPKAKTVAPARKYTNRINGIAFGPEGVLYGCQEGSRRVIRLMPDGSATVTATRVGGRVHNHPNRIVVDKRGHVWFSDLRNPVAASGPQLFPPPDHQSVLRLWLGERPRNHWHIERVTYDTSSPRGVALSPDEKTLYVAESDERAGGVRELRAYPIESDGTVRGYTVLHTFGADSRGIHRGIDGLCVDKCGNIIACAGWRRSGPGPLLYVFAPGGAIQATYPIPEDMPMNCAFGDDGLKSIYVGTAGGHLLRLRDSGISGHVQYP